MKTYVVVEGQADKPLLKRVLPPEMARNVQVVESGGRNRLSTVAATILSDHRGPCLTIADAGSREKSVIAERRDWLEAVIGQSADPSLPSKLLIAAPSLSAVLFASPSLLHATFGGAIPDRISVMAEYSPTDAVREWAKLSGKHISIADIVENIEEEHAAEIRQHPIMTEIIDFLAAADPTAEQARKFSL